jgi:hypothetical protein
VGTMIYAYFPVVLKINSSDAAIREKEVVKHVSSSCVSEPNHVIVKNVDDFFFNACSTFV